jgi:hypothetical protein
VVCLALTTGCLVWLAFARNNAELPVTPDTRPVAVFIGDSYTQPGTWPEVVAEAQGWQMLNLGSGSTGYVARSTGKTAQKGCGRDVCRSFVEMADIAIEQQPDVVVVAGGRNDQGHKIDRRLVSCSIRCEQGCRTPELSQSNQCGPPAHIRAFLFATGA